MKMSVTTILALGDNFIYVVEYEPGHAFVVDPGESAMVGEVLEQCGLVLKTILVTHHHYDHAAGVLELKKRWGCRVIGPDTRVAGIDIIAEETPVISMGKRKIDVLVTPGHTTTGVCYYVEPARKGSAGMVFTGDTMFIGGCGRVLEGDMEVMYDSLWKLAELSDETLVYPGHDYTEENYEFALTVDPNNDAIAEQLAKIRRSANPPSTIGREKETNIFLLANSAKRFAALRSRKDKF